MKNAMQRLKKHNKKGFTLVELLVVLVILAILAAAIIPSMMGFIDRAKKESIAAEQRSVLLAAQVEVNEMYGKGTLDTLASTNTSVTIDSKDATKDYLAAIVTLADLPGTITEVTVSKNSATVGSGEADGHWTITGAKYTAKDGTTKYEYTVTGTGTTQEAVWKEVKA